MNCAYEVNEVLLSVGDVCYSIGGRRILDDVSFEIRNITRPDVTTGQVVSILGRSGIGKTRLLRIIAGLDDPSSGQVVGENGQPTRRGDVGMVFQECPLFRHRTVIDNLVIAAMRRSASKREAIERSNSVADRLGLSGVIRSYPAQLSGGQRQRASIAQQLLSSGHLVLMDEPVSGLDPITTGSVCALIRDVASLDDLNTIVITTHNIEAALAVSDSVLLLASNGDRGASVRERYDLARLGLAWNFDSASTAERRELKDRIERRMFELG